MILAGSVLTTIRGNRVYVAAFACLIVGAVLTSLKAYDVMRMYSLMTPIALIGVATYLRELHGRSQTTAIVLVVLIISNVTIAFPETLFTGSADGLQHLEEFYRAHRWRIAGVQGSATAFALASLYSFQARRVPTGTS